MNLPWLQWTGTGRYREEMDTIEHEDEMDSGKYAYVYDKMADHKYLTSKNDTTRRLAWPCRYCGTLLPMGPDRCPWERCQAMAILEGRHW